MNKIILALTALVMIATSAAAQMGNKMPTRFQAVSMDKAQIVQEGEAKMFCPNCGMTLPMFYKTNHAATVDGKTQQFCSIHCLAETMQEGKKVTDIQVVDNTTLKFIDAAKASYVVGSDKPGTMTKTSKYAFGTQADAEAFAKEHGGKVMGFEETLTAVKASLAKETAMIRKKQGKMAEKGEMMYNKMCKSIDANFHSVAEAKSYLKMHKPCGDIKGKKLQAIGIHLNSRNK